MGREVKQKAGKNVARLRLLSGVSCYGDPKHDTKKLDSFQNNDLNQHERIKSLGSHNAQTWAPRIVRSWGSNEIPWVPQSTT